MIVNGFQIGPDAHLAGVDLNNANLKNADLNEANLRSANLSAANLTEADLWGASLAGAMMRDGWQDIVANYSTFWNENGEPD